jgi:hypothetical protein
MDHDRRKLLTAAIGGAVVGTGSLADTLTRASAEGTASGGAMAELPKGLTFATLRRPDGMGLGVRTDRGILDVMRAEQDFAERGPTTITDVFKGNGEIAGLERLIGKAKASGAADRYFVA